MITVKQFAKLMDDQAWRLENLYYITDDKGVKTLFKMNRAQREFFKARHYKNVVLKARQLGMSTFIQLFMLDMALFYDNTECGVIAHTLKDATKMFRTKIKYAYDNLPDWVKVNRPIKACNSTELVLENGSSITVGTSLRSGTLQFLHVSEFGKIAAKNPGKAEEIITGSFNTLAPDSWAFIESTAEGQEGYFYDYVQTARTNENMGNHLTEEDWKFHFFPWYDEPRYNIKSSMKIPDDQYKYFEMLQDSLGIKLSHGQRVWYVKKLAAMKDKMSREFPSTPDEAFASSMDGSYYGSIFAKLEKNGQIRNIPHDPLLEVETYWDIGMRDYTSIWFVQRVGNEIRLIDYYENTGEGLSHYARILKEKAVDGNWRYARHVGPHDSKVREWTRDGQTRQELAEAQGLKPWIITSPLSVNEGIDLVRTILPQCYFDETKCAKGITSLKKYRKDWNDKLGIWRNQPRHDESSHAADAFRTLATAPKNKQIDAWDEAQHIPDYGAI